MKPPEPETPEPEEIEEADLTGELNGPVVDEEDFTGDDIGGDLDMPIELGRKRENVRGRLATALIGLLALVVIGAGVISAAGWLTVKQVGELLEILLPPVVALTGTAIGFYFGGQQAEAASSQGRQPLGRPTTGRNSGSRGGGRADGPRGR